MTANQINFYKAKQEAKHWKRSDRETKRHNTADEAIREQTNTIQNWWNQQQAAHLVRSDAINKAHYERMDSETQRHNKMNEKVDLLYYDTIDYPKGQADIEYTEAKSKSEPLYAINDNIIKSAQAGYLNMQTKYYPIYYVMDKARSDAQNFGDYAGAITDAVRTVLPQVRINFAGGAASSGTSTSGINSSGRYSNYSVKVGR